MCGHEGCDVNSSAQNMPNKHMVCPNEAMCVGSLATINAVNDVDVEDSGRGNAQEIEVEIEHVKKLGHQLQVAPNAFSRETPPDKQGCVNFSSAVDSGHTNI